MTDVLLKRLKDGELSHEALREAVKEIERLRKIDWLFEDWRKDAQKQNADLRARIAALETALDEAIEYVAGHDDEWPKALAVRLRAARAALGEKE
jgi:hypothetical protein